MKVSFHGVGEQIVSFEAAADVQPGGTVKLSDNGKAAACGDGDVICGTAVTVRGGIAATAAAVEIYDEQICIPLLQPLPL